MTALRTVAAEFITEVARPGAGFVGSDARGLYPSVCTYASVTITAIFMSFYVAVVLF